MVSRFVSVVVVALFVNPFKHEKIPFSHQLVMTMGGLRGAVAFYLALNVSSEYKHLIITTTISIILFTIIGMGSVTPFFLKWLDKTFPQDEILNKESEEDQPLTDNDANGFDPKSFQPSDVAARKSLGVWSKAENIQKDYMQTVLRRPGWEGRMDKKDKTNADQRVKQHENIEQHIKEEEKRLTDMRGDLSPNRTSNAVTQEIQNRLTNSVQRMGNDDNMVDPEYNRGRVQPDYNMEDSKKFNFHSFR